MIEAPPSGPAAGDAGSAADTPGTTTAPETPAATPAPSGVRVDSDTAFLQTEASASYPVSQHQPIEVHLPERFELLRVLGAGGMGQVVLAHDRVLGRDVAIKVLRTTDFGDLAMRDRLLHEAQAAAQIRHPNIVGIHDVDLDHGLIVMEYLPKGSGRKLLEERGALPFRE